MTREEFLEKLSPLLKIKGHMWCAEEDTFQGHINNIGKNLIDHSRVIEEVFNED